MAREFDELALDGHNYPTWALDIKISLVFRGMAALTPLAERERGNISGYLQVPGTIHHPQPSPPDLKSEYMMEEEPHSLWVALKGHYEQQKAILLP
jgi:hypothetical protein